jgi:hypothetical protein
MVRRLFFLVSIIALTAGRGLSQGVDYTTLVNRYIQLYQDIAVKEMMVYRIPASITLAQGILESNAGTSRLAREANNHFGIKCHKDWIGKSFYQDDDEKNECFRKYEDPVESFRDHSYFLTLRERYKALFELEITDYQGWARGLKAAGYATNPAYATKLISIIEKFSLHRFDHTGYASLFGDSLANLEDERAREAWLNTFVVFAIGPNGRKVYENNRLQMTVARRGDNILTIARDFDVDPKNLAGFNDMKGSTLLKPGQVVYLESKRRRAAVDTHQVKDRETLFSIAQMYGVKLKVLAKRNRIPQGLEPPAGMLLKLR